MKKFLYYHQKKYLELKYSIDKTVFWFYNDGELRKWR